MPSPGDGIGHHLGTRLFRRKSSRPGPAEHGFACIGCGDWHSKTPQSFHIPAPDVWSPELEGTEGCELGSDMCVIDDEQFFVRGLVQIPVAGLEEPMEWGVWVSVCETDITAIARAWKKRGLESAPPIDGRLANNLWVYEQATLGLSVHLHTQPKGLRFLVELTTGDHQLAREQREGLSHEAFLERVAQLLHSE